MSFRPKKDAFVFFDGPPFATGLPHYGHLLSFVTKDVFPRFATMKNMRCERKWGWDCHGLPIENLCERELKISQKNEILDMGIAKFNEYCRSKVLWYVNEWKSTVDRMGKWIEFDNSYKTMDNSYMESVWNIFKTAYDRGYVYRGKKVLLYCPRCETPLSNSEISMDNSYRDVSETSAIAKFKLHDQENTYFLAWTTTPWTLIGNVALAVNPNQQYVKVGMGEEFFILNHSRVETLQNDYEIVEEFSGNSLIGLKYDPLYPIPLKESENAYLIIDGGEEVSSEEGTGIVHLAIYGEFDYKMIEKYKLAIIQHVGLQGKLELGPEEWFGSWFKDLDSIVLKDLEDRNLLFSTEIITHSYPFCYRCETPLMYNALDAWFVNIQKLKPKLFRTADFIKWYPEGLEKRFHYILETAPDWCISRNRFWATALPIWECSKCHSISVMGSVGEMQQRAIEPVPDNMDLHKHYVDDIHLTCLDCGSPMNRIPEVFDCWFESGSMPYASIHYPFENRKNFKTRFPADFVSEYVGQVRAWFYYMHVISVLLFDSVPFKNVVVNGNILAEDGSKMSKSKRNYPDPDNLIQKYGADALRFYLLASPLMRAQDLAFREEGVKQIYRKYNLLLYNILRFFKIFVPNSIDISNTEPTDVMDRWIISLVNKLVKDTTKSLNEYDTAEYCRFLIQFVDDLSTWYVKNSKNRFNTTDLNEKPAAIRSLVYVLDKFSRVIAPITPFIAEMIHMELYQLKMVEEKSVHLEMWPNPKKLQVDNEILASMEKTRLIISKALELRVQENIPIRQVLSEIFISGSNLGFEFQDLIARAINVKKILIDNRKGELELSLNTEITPELKIEGISRHLIRHINNVRKKHKLWINDRIQVFLSGDDPELAKCINKFESHIKKSVQADAIHIVKSVKGDMKEIVINGQKLRISIEQRT